MIENIRLSFQGIWAHKMRSFLTMLGIIIGIAALISIVSTIAGTNEQIKKNLIGEGDNVIEITLNGNGGEYQIEYEGLPQGVPVISQEQKEEILDLEEVEQATLYQMRQYADSIYYQDKSLDGGMVLGIDEDYLDTRLSEAAASQKRIIKTPESWSFWMKQRRLTFLKKVRR